jgi:hypothetical protein
MHRHLLALSSALGLATLVGCASSSKPPDDPVTDPGPGPSDDSPPQGDQPADPPSGSVSDPEPPKGAEPKKGSGDSGSIPDDYVITHGDCVLLGKQFAVVNRNDQLATLSPKLTDKQRSQAEGSINEGANKIGEKFAESCQKSSAGSHGDPKALKCALNSKTAKEFDACLNAPVPPK